MVDSRLSDDPLYSTINIPNCFVKLRQPVNPYVLPVFLIVLVASLFLKISPFYVLPLIIYFWMMYRPNYSQAFLDTPS
jgi:uncharacterized membrane protein